jgi:hypothetical protein
MLVREVMSRKPVTVTPELSAGTTGHSASRT